MIGRNTFEWNIHVQRGERSMNFDLSNTEKMTHLIKVQTYDYICSPHDLKFLKLQDMWLKM